MADEVATVDQLLAELRELRALHAASRDENAALREREAALTAESGALSGGADHVAEEQAATREILRAIARSPPDTQTVLDAILTAAATLHA